MKKSLASRVATGAATAGLALAAMACNVEAPTGSAPGTALRADQAAADDSAVTASVLVRLDPVSSEVTHSVVIDRRGGTVELKSLGMMLVVPSDAVAEPVTFSVTAKAGKLIAYDFAPHMTFRRPLQFEQTLKNTNYKSLPAASEIEGAYVRDLGTLDQSRGVARVDEFRPARVDKVRNRVRFEIEHFSGYVIATGGKKGSG